MGLRKDDPGTLPAGHVINGRYAVIRALGSGGMGSVYLASDEVLNENVAIKILHANLLTDEKQMQRFLREVQLMRRINQRNVVRTFDVGSDGDLVYFTMEYIPGRPLEDYAEKGNYPLKDIGSLITQVCEGLEAIHAAGVIHRDLKPANIIVIADGTPKITDFGVARPEYSELTGHNEIVGSALYIAPEVWLGTKMSASLDLYSLGVIVYEITTGVLPFEGDSPAALMRMHLEYSPPEPKSINKQIPSWLNKLTLRLLAKSPLDRPKDAREVIEYVELQTGNVRANLTAEEKTDDSAKFMRELEAMNAKSTSEHTVEPEIAIKQGRERIVRETNTLIVSESLGRTMINRLLLMAITLFLFLGGERAVFGLRRLIEPEVLLGSIDAFGTLLARGEPLPAPGWLLLSAFLRALQTLLYSVFPLVFIGACAGNPRAMNRFIKRSIVLLGVVFLALFTSRVLPTLRETGIDALTVYSATVAASEQTIQIAYLDSFTSRFEQTVVSEGLVLAVSTPTRSAMSPVSLIGSLVVLFFAAIFIHRIFEPFTWRSGRAAMIVVGFGLVANLSAQLIAVRSEGLVLGFYLPQAVLFCWAIMYVLIFFGTLFLRPNREVVTGSNRRR